MRCDGNCAACTRPVSKCHGGDRSRTAYTDPSQRPTYIGAAHTKPLPTIHACGKAGRLYVRKTRQPR